MKNLGKCKDCRFKQPPLLRQKSNSHKRARFSCFITQRNRTAGTKTCSFHESKYGIIIIPNRMS